MYVSNLTSQNEIMGFHWIYSELLKQKLIILLHWINAAEIKKYLESIAKMF